MSSNGPWKDQWVCIAGGTSGFGSVLAEEFALKGAKVAILGRDVERGRSAAERLNSKTPGSIEFFKVDLAEPDSIQASDWSTWLKEVDLKAAVAAAGQSDRGYLHTLSKSDLDRLWTTNVTTSLLFSQACRDSLKRGRGTLVHIASLAGLVATPGLGGYSIVKHAVVALSRQMRIESADDGIKVLTFCPGPIRRSDEQGGRYDHLVESRQLPDNLKEPAGSRLVKVLEPNQLGRRLIAAIENGDRELVVPAKAKWLAGLGNLFPSLFPYFLKSKR